MPVSAGTILFNRYRVASRLGQGGFGAVYRAWDLTLSKPCAIKENFDVSPEAQRQFLREATVLANLTHPNLPRVTDHFVVEGQGQYLVMDYVEGDDLDKIITTRGVVKPEQALDWINQVLDALVYLHSRIPPVIHRDIKPANIKITPEGKAVLVDFGLVKLFDPHLKTTAGARAVTAGFSPPEQYGQGTTDARTDIYALGATMYMLLTGVAPLESVLRAGQDTLEKVHERNPAVPLELSKVIAHAMELGPGQRFQNAADFQKALQNSLLPSLFEPAIPVGMPTTAQAAATPPTALPTAHIAASPVAIPRPRPQKTNWNNSVAFAIAGATLILGIFIIVFLGLGGPKLFVKKEATSTLSSIVFTKTPHTIKATIEPTTIPITDIEPPIVIEGMIEESFGIPLTVINSNCGEYDFIKEIRAVDEYTVQFSLCKPDPAFLEKMTCEGITIQPKEWIAWTNGNGDLLKQPIGTGPYYVSEWRKGDSIILKRNPYFAGDPSLTETAIIRWDNDSQIRLRKLQAGDADEAINLDSVSIEQALADPTLQVLVQPSSSTFYIGLNNTASPLNIQGVRQAIALGLDRQAIIDKYLPYGSKLATHLTPCIIEHGCDGEEFYPYDPAKAKELMANAGYPDGFTINLYFRNVQRSYLQDPIGVAKEIQIQLKENLNIDVNLVENEPGDFIQKVYQGQLDGMYFFGWSADYNHISNFIGSLLRCDNLQFGTPYSELCSIVETASTMNNPGDLYTQINKGIQELVPLIPVAYTANIYVASADLQEVNPPAWGSPDLALIEPGDGRDTVNFLQEAEPQSLYCMDESDTPSLTICHQILQGLMQNGEDGTPVPALASSYSISDDMMVYTFRLQKGVRFQNGFAVDANDVVASFAAALDVTNPYHTGNTGTFDFPGALFGFIND
jgi:ABC-type transport system substrate-binding protein/serine/threonine protein kinase